ncbi:MAG: RimK family protein [Candidatus Marinimicrobia bacterium]|nr:RimK family protein [Candidatus Neomarinimicrobiota bacterium]
MSIQIVIVENLNDWPKHFPAATVVTAKDYISKLDFFKLKNAQIVNFCRSYQYLSMGYYCSLLAAARRQRAIPRVRTITELSRKSIYSINVEDLDELVQRVLKKRDRGTTEIEFNIFFGMCQQIEFAELARQIFDLFRCPLLKVELKYSIRWQITSIRPITINNLPKDKQAFFIDTFSKYSQKRWQTPRLPKQSRFDLAILYNPKEQLPPSNRRALKKFITIGKKAGLSVELIEKKDYSSLPEYDALFIRETTQINHHSYLFSKRAEAEGMVVIDDPDSIVKCTNKVYLAELLTANNIATPGTLILKEDDLKNISNIENLITYPVILKIPDSSFSKGVFKAKNQTEFKAISDKLFEESDLILAQEYMYTNYDWRIGIFNRLPLFACQYFMSKKHWQIVKHNPSGSYSEGEFRTFAVEDAPQAIVKLASKAAGLIGNGLYGVDIKVIGQKPYVIEINDNPNIDAGVEDDFLGDRLYQIIIDEFIRRIELSKSR